MTNPNAPEPIPQAPASDRSRLAVLWIVLGALALVTLLMLSLDVIVPGNWTIERSILINAPKHTIHEVAGDLSHWHRWAQWDQQSAPTVNTVSQPSQGPGARLQWTTARPSTNARANNPLSKPTGQASGSVTIERSDPEQGLWLLSTVVNSPPSRASITYASRLGATEVTWTATGEMGQLLGGLSVDRFQQQLGKHVETGLLKLKEIAEQNSRKPSDQALQ